MLSGCGGGEPSSLSLLPVLSGARFVDPTLAGDELRQRLGELNLLSEALVAKAGSGSTPAHEFRIEARMYRELLRQTMLDEVAGQHRRRPPAAGILRRGSSGLQQ